MIKDMPKFIEISEKFSECGKCQTKMKKDYASEMFQFDIDDEQVYITVNNVPIHKCENCDEEYFSLRISSTIEKLIDKELFYMLNNKERDKIPTEIDFSKFVELKR